MNKPSTKKLRTAEFLTAIPCQGYVLELEDNKVPFEKLQELVGGRVAIIRTKKGLTEEVEILCVNEEGRKQGLPLNIDASEIAGFPIFGDAVSLSHRSLL